MGIEVIDQLTQRARREQYVTIDTEHIIGVGLVEHHIAHGGSLEEVERHIAIAAHPSFEGFEVCRARTVGMIVDDQDFGFLSNFGVEEADGLDGEVDAVIVIVSGHSDAKFLAHGIREFAPRAAWPR